MRVDKHSAIIGGIVGQLVGVVLALLTDISWVHYALGGLLVTCIFLATANPSKD